jgi:hypothetical protein
MSSEPGPSRSVEDRDEIVAASSASPPPEVIPPIMPQRRSGYRQLMILVGSALVGYLAVAYILMPALWQRYARRHPSLVDIPGITHTGSGIPADPLNVALIGTETELKKLMVAAGWYPADPLTFASCLKIASGTVLKRPYDDAPVSNLYLFGRRQDLAFEKPVGDNPRKRHHVRFWVTDKTDPDGRPVWVGAAIYDERVGFSHTTGQITHHTGAAIDEERDYLFDDLQQTGDLVEVYIVEGFHKVLQGRNGGGDPWHTDGTLDGGVMKPMP